MLPDILKQFGLSPRSAAASVPSARTQSQQQPQQSQQQPQQPQQSMSGDDDLHVFLDGSCIGNGSKHAKGGYAGVFPNNPQLTFSETLRASPAAPATNNKAEYMALIRAHEIAPPNVRMTVFTDSMLLYKTYTEWLPVWKRKGWKKADGSTVMNLDLVQRLDKIKSERHITIKHVRAHTGGTDYHSVQNAEADRLAKEAAVRG